MPPAGSRDSDRDNETQSEPTQKASVVTAATKGGQAVGQVVQEPEAGLPAATAGVCCSGTPRGCGWGCRATRALEEPLPQQRPGRHEAADICCCCSCCDGGSGLLTRQTPGKLCRGDWQTLLCMVTALGTIHCGQPGRPLCSCEIRNSVHDEGTEN